MCVIGRSASSLAGMSVSSSRIGTRPTCATHTAACTDAVGNLHADLERRAVAAARAPHRQLVRVEVGLGVLLVPIGVDLLAEVAAPVEEADADERQRRVRRRLAVVAGQDAEAAGVELHRLVDAELGAEVGDRAGQRCARRTGVPGVGAVRHVAAELVEHAAGVDHEVLVGGQLGPARLIGVAQDGDRVPVTRPAARVDAGEERLCAGRPGPPQVVGELPEPCEVGRKVEVVAGQGRHVQGSRHERR